MRQLSGFAVLALLMAIRSQAQASAQVTSDVDAHTTFHFRASGSTAALPPEANSGEPLPDAPGVQLAEHSQQDTLKPALDPCAGLPRSSSSAPGADGTAQAGSPCTAPQQNPYKRFLDNGKPIPLSPKQKGYLAFHDVIDPFNLLTIVANSAVTVAIDPHSAYGPGMKGFGRSIGYSFSQDATGEVIGTFGICSLLHEDPHYHRMPTGTPFNRVVHAISRTVIAQHDDGTPMPNYEVLLTYPASAEISNLYIPGVNGNGPSTVARILIGLATDPINNLVTEFLPDFAKRFHVRVVFLQQIINQVASGQPGSP